MGSDFTTRLIFFNLRRITSKIHIFCVQNLDGLNLDGLVKKIKNFLKINVDKLKILCYNTYIN